MNEKYQPHTIEEQEGYQNGFEFAIYIVLQMLDKHDDKALFSVHKFIAEFKEEIIEEVQAIRNDW